MMIFGGVLLIADVFGLCGNKDFFGPAIISILFLVSGWITSRMKKSYWIASIVMIGISALIAEFFTKDVFQFIMSLAVFLYLLFGDPKNHRF